MTIQREDLVAAAAVGLLQYRQIDPLLIFLLQRDVRAQRAALAAGIRPARRGPGSLLLTCLVAMLVMVSAALFAVLYTTPAGESLSAGMLFLATALYAIAALGLASWFRRRGQGVPARILSALAIAMAPLLVLALQQAAR